LRQALAVAPGHLPEPPPAWWSHVLFWSNSLSFPEKAYSALTALLIAALAACVALLLRRPRIYWLCALLLVIGAVMTVDAGLAASVSGSRHGVVIHETVARKGIGKDYEPAFDQPLKDGAEFSVLSENGDWVLGHFEGIGDGWLRKVHVVM
jgi:hypothetical protein